MRQHVSRAAVLCTLALASAALAQQPPSPAVVRVSSRLVVLDVSVLDAAGVSVTDLTRNDFTIYESGQPERIHSFEPFDAHRLPPSATAASLRNTADLQRLAPNAPVTVLVLDELNTAFEDTAFARTSLRKYLLARDATLTEPTTLLTVTDAGFQQVQDYTLDRGRLLDALAHLKGAYPFSLLRTGGSPEGRAIRFAQTLASLQQVAQATSGHQGRKNILWVGSGFQSIDLRNEPDRQVQLVKGAAERTVNLLREAHVTVYTVDPTLSTKIAGEPQADTTQTDPSAFTAETHQRGDPFSDTVSFNTLAPRRAAGPSP